MAVANVQTVKQALKKAKLVEITDEKELNGHFIAPKSATGKEFIIFLPEYYT